MHYTYEIVREWEGYEDGNYVKNLNLVMSRIDPEGVADFDNWVMSDMGNLQLSDKGKCVCSQNIHYLFYAEHIITKDTIDLGSACIHKFNGDYKKTTSFLRRKHKGPTFKFCPYCNRKLPNTIVSKFNDGEIPYHKSCYDRHQKELKDNEPVECEWCDIKPARKDFDEHMKTHADDIAYSNASNRIIKFGKYKGLKLSEIRKKDSGYIRWLSGNAYDSTLANDAKIIL